MKRVFAIILSFVLILSLAACSTEPEKQNEQTQLPTIEQVEATDPSETAPSENTDPTQEPTNEDTTEQETPGDINLLISLDKQFDIFEPTGTIADSNSPIHDFLFVRDIDQLVKNAIYTPTWIDASQLTLSSLKAEVTWGDLKTKPVNSVAILKVSFPGLSTPGIMSFVCEDKTISIEEAFNSGYWVIMLGEGNNDKGELIGKRNEESAAEAIMRVFGQPSSIVCEQNPYGIEFLSKYAAMFNYETENIGLQLCVNEASGFYLFTMSIMGKPVNN